MQVHHDEGVTNRIDPWSCANTGIGLMVGSGPLDFCEWVVNGP
jgi:hypothetical protein